MILLVILDMTKLMEIELVITDIDTDIASDIASDIGHDETNGDRTSDY